MTVIQAAHRFKPSTPWRIQLDDDGRFVSATGPDGVALSLVQWQKAAPDAYWNYTDPTGERREMWRAAGAHVEDGTRRHPAAQKVP